MRKLLLTIVFSAISIFSFSQQNAYYQQSAKYKMDIDIDAQNFTYQGNQTLTYINNSPDELKVVYFHLYWINTLWYSFIKRKGSFLPLFGSVTVFACEACGFGAFSFAPLGLSLSLSALRRYRLA